MLKNATEPTFDNTSRLRIAERTESTGQQERERVEQLGRELETARRPW